MAAKQEWKRISAELIAIGLLASVDRAALAAYCAAWSRWIKAEEAIERFGAVIKSPRSGFPINNPWIGIANTSLTLMRQFLTEFGMTPASRSRINIDPGRKPADPFKAFMESLGAEDITNDSDILGPGKSVCGERSSWEDPGVEVDQARVPASPE